MDRRETKMLLKEFLLFVVLATLCSWADSKPQPCQAGWMEKGGMCYKYVGNKLNYATARKKCQAHGGDLAMPKTPDGINNIISVRTKSKSKKKMWIGLNDMKSEGKYVWRDGTSLYGGKKSYLWMKGQPNGYGDCVNVWSDGKLRDTKCNKKFASICQKDPIILKPEVLPPIPTIPIPDPIILKPEVLPPLPLLPIPENPVTMVRRVQGKVDFHQTWAAYEKGFGNCEKGDCWIGLSALHKLCMKNCKLHVTMTYKGKTYNADYTTFKIGPKSDNYRMTVGGYSGNAGDSMIINNNMQFSTKDKENDKWESNCSLEFTGGWWYNACHHAHPTGTWGSKAMGKGIVWKTITTQYDSLSSITMKLTPAV